ncbi:MAG: metallophosphoesterase, partial [Acidobacteria bacterium]|nr:metallophosphoesterase [Acidobacteriota bacterium]
MQPADAKPHHLVFVADPQLTDPKSYPGRPWPLADLTIKVTDNYLRRGYSELQQQLQPDSLFFLGDLFDGGREWATPNADFEDAKWATPYPSGEKDYAPLWRKRYGQDYWLEEYLRFSDIFFKPYYDEDTIDPGAESTGRRLVAGLPGNHDLGFGSMVKVPVRDRFAAYFGEANRVDVVGNHTIVSVDTVSLSAGTSEQAKTEDLKHIHGPADEFLRGVKNAKRRVVQEELRFWRHDPVESQLDPTVTDAQQKRDAPPPGPQAEVAVADLPTILLTHVPLYRAPGTPCGPLREHWPPSKPDADGVPPAVDHRNAISVTSGFQYQNVLNPADSAKLLDSVGGVKHVFSGDDHDYCEVKHEGGATEITVKSI